MTSQEIQCFLWNIRYAVAESVLHSAYSIPLVVLSVFIAIISSFSAFGAADRITKSSKQINKITWTIFGATALGFGIWSMHFIAMLALRLPIPVVYDVKITIISVVPAVIASSVVLWMMAKPNYSRVNLLLDGLLLGAGIGLMHHTGMMAMRMNATIHHDPFLFYLSLSEAVVMATIALKIKRQAIEERLTISFISDDK
ncbi:MAG: MHYT domain-containing protein [Gammaproteobacteria bacterium]|nr:MHYT domain-containing protein [Gammaproteobacteria bacterium]